MIDEPTEGLAPLIVHQVGDLIAEIARRGVAILLVEQKLSIAMRISHRVYVMGHGCIVFEGTPTELTSNDAVRKRTVTTVPDYVISACEELITRGLISPSGEDKQP
jgi:ABC-type branched-subunit amino acid transport system ATPase component